MSSDSRVLNVRIEKIEKHPNADTLSIVNVFGGYPCIIRTGDFQEGDIASYIPVDMVVPVKPEFSFLITKDKPTRIRAKKLRGVFSMGVLVKPPIGSVEGEDVTDLLGITKWEPEEIFSKCISRPGGKFLPGDAENDPGFLPAYTDIENLRKYRSLLEGVEIVVTEKIHGCLRNNARITMSDGSYKKISHINIGDEVLGVDNGKLIPSKVTQVFRNGYTNKWLSIKGERSGAGRGSSFFSITCTPEHKFWNPVSNSYICASDLKTGSEVSLHRTDMCLTPLQEQVILGKLLGDGSLSIGKLASHISWTHRGKDAEYVEWTANALGELTADAVEYTVSGFGTKMVKRRTHRSSWLHSRFSSMIVNNRKSVPEWVGDLLGPIALAFWYMDDGSLGEEPSAEYKAHFAVCSFTEHECNILLKGLERLGIRGVYYKSEGYSRIRLNTDAAERMFLLVAPYIPPSMQRKLPPRYRGGSGWIPNTGSSYKPMLVTQRVTSISEIEERAEKIDIETETHNYFAYGVLVHNSNAGFVWHTSPPYTASAVARAKAEGKIAVKVTSKSSEVRYTIAESIEHALSKYIDWQVETVEWSEFELQRGEPEPRLWIRSRRQFKKPEGGGIWADVAKAYNFKEVLKKVCPSVGIYGEVYGQVQDLNYGYGNSVDLTPFDSIDLQTRKYFDYDDFIVLINRINVELSDRNLPLLKTAPLLYRGKFDYDLMKSLAEGTTVLGNSLHVREGIVVKPTKEMWDSRLERVILKLPGEGYLTR